MSKLAEAKQDLANIKDNFAKEAERSVQNGNTDDDQAPVFSLSAKKENLHKLEAKVKEIKAKVPALV